MQNPHSANIRKYVFSYLRVILVLVSLYLGNALAQDEKCKVSFAKESTENLCRWMWSDYAPLCKNNIRSELLDRDLYWGPQENCGVRKRPLLNSITPIEDSNKSNTKCSLNVKNTDTPSLCIYRWQSLGNEKCNDEIDTELKYHRKVFASEDSCGKPSSFLMSSDGRIPPKITTDKNCNIPISENILFSVLNSRLVLEPFIAPSFQYLALKQKPNAKEKAAIATYAAEIEKCGLSASFDRSDLPTEYKSSLGVATSDILASLADLHSGKFTYGDYAKARLKSLAELKVLAEERTKALRLEQEANAARRRDLETEKRQAEARQREAEQAAQQRAYQLREDESQRRIRDEASCKNEAASYAAANRPSASSGNTSTSCTNLGGGMINCNTKSAKGGFSNGFMQGWSAADEGAYFRNCMKLRGW